jgi:hypothetical protein
MERLAAHPLTASFRAPFSPGDAPQNYFQIVTNPLNLTEISTRLAEGKYADLNAWFDDVELVWSNCDAYYTSDASKSFTTPIDRRYYAVVTAELRRIFAKEKTLFVRLGIGNWSRALYELRTEVTDLMTRPPAKVRQFTPSLGTVRTMKQSASSLSDRELHRFLAMANELTADEDQREMVRIVAEGHPELDTGAPELRVDVTKLNLATIQALKEFVRAAFERQGKKYVE